MGGAKALGVGSLSLLSPNFVFTQLFLLFLVPFFRSFIMRPVYVFASLSLVAAVSANADVILSARNFNNLNLGNLSSDATGATAGQDGWFTYTTAPSGVANFQVVADPNAANSNGTVAHNGGQVLQIQDGNTSTGNNVTRYAWNDDLHNAANPANTSFEMKYDFYMGSTSTTSTNRYGNYFYDLSGTKILSGVTMQNNTGQFYIVGSYNNAGTIGNYSFSTGTSGILARNTWYSFKVTFDSVTGRFQGGFSNDGGVNYTMFFVDGAAAGISVDEYDLIGSANSGTAAQGAPLGFYDNITVTAAPAPGAIALLGLAGLIGRRRR